MKHPDMELRHTLTSEQIEFLKCVQQASENGFDHFLNLTIGIILKDGKYSDVDRNTMNTILIPNYKKWKALSTGKGQE